MSKKPFFTGPFAPICESYVAQKGHLVWTIAAGQTAAAIDNFAKIMRIQSYTITKEIALTWCKKRQMRQTPPDIAE